LSRFWVRPLVSLAFDALFGHVELVHWEDLEESLQLFQLSVVNDSTSWIIEASGGFSTSSLYKAFHDRVAIFRFKELWN
jgi:hypothetical protein